MTLPDDFETAPTGTLKTLDEKDVKIQRLKQALTGLLEDTQHSEHYCPDPECPVKVAREALEDT